MVRKKIGQTVKDGQFLFAELLGNMALILNIQLLPHELYQPLKEHIHIHTPGIIFISLHPLMESVLPGFSSLSSGFTLETPPKQMSQRKWEGTTSR